MGTGSRVGEVVFVGIGSGVSVTMGAGAGVFVGGGGAVGKGVGVVVDVWVAVGVGEAVLVGELARVGWFTVPVAASIAASGVRGGRARAMSWPITTRATIPASMYGRM